MTIFKEYDITVDLVSGVTQDGRMTFDQNDYNSSRINVTITNKSVPINLTGSTVSIAFLKKDKTSVFQACTISDAAQGKVQVVLSSQTLAVPGLVKSELTINNAGDTTTTSGFYFNVKDSIMNDNTVQSANEFSLIQKAIDAGETLGDVDLDTIVNNTTNVNGLIELTGDHSDILDDHSAQLAKADRQSQVLSHGLAVVNAEGNSPVDVEVQGRTLIPMQNSNLVGNGYYVLADKKTKVKVEGREGAYIAGVGKFQKSASLSTTGNFVGKVSGSVTENAHIAKIRTGADFIAPSSINTEFTQGRYTDVASLNGSSTPVTVTSNGQMGQALFSFNIIEQVERKMGRIPAVDTAGKVQWLKDNVNLITANWHGFGSSVGGNKATFAVFRNSNSSWTEYTHSHTNNTVTQRNLTLSVANGWIGLSVDSNGFVHFLAYAEPSDGVTASTINTDFVECVIELKSTAQLDTRPQLLRVANYEGKVSASTVENPHIGKTINGAGTLLAPSNGSFTEIGAGSFYPYISSLGNGVLVSSNTVNGSMAQQLFSFDLIAEVERNIGRIPRTSVADKVTWLKANVAKLTANWHGYGSSVGGNRATLRGWNADGNYYITSSHVNGTVTKLSSTAQITLNANYILSDGFIHYLVNAEPSDGVTASTINSDYIELEIELKPEAILHDPSVPLYEVDSVDYGKILVDWNESAVLTRYPKVTGVQHLQNPYVMAEGENLLPPFSEWSFNAAQYTVNSPYSITALAQSTTISTKIKVLKNTDYTFSANLNGGRWILQDGITSAVIINYNYVTPVTFNTGNSDEIVLALGTSSSAVVPLIMDNPMLTLGSTAKPFVPRNPSYLFAETKLGQIGTLKDVLYRDADGWKVRKVVEKDFILDGSLSWSYNVDKVGVKRVIYNKPTGIPDSTNDIIVTKHNGLKLKGGTTSDGRPDESQIASGGILHINIADSDSGWTDTMGPINTFVKAYFNGWKYTGDGATHSWVSIVDGSAPATNTDAYVSANKAPNYTPYKLSYVLATPQIVPVNVEGDIAVSGATQVEVGSGVIVREKVVPVLNGGQTQYWVNNNTYFPTGNLKNKVSKSISIYKNSTIDTKWGVSTSDGYGKQSYYIPKADFDTTAEYTVTYLLLERDKFTNNGLDYKVIYANSIRSAFDDMVAKQSDLATSVSVNIKAIAELYKRVKSLGG